MLFYLELVDTWAVDGTYADKNKALAAAEPLPELFLTFKLLIKTMCRGWEYWPPS